MAYVKVNHRTLKEVARAMNSYCDTQNSKMRAADGAVKNMLENGRRSGAGWEGADAHAFGDMWEGVDESNSVTVKFRENIRKYSEILEKCAEEYENAQYETCKDANWIYNIARAIVW